MRLLVLFAGTVGVLSAQDAPQFDFYEGPPEWLLGVRDGVLIAVSYAILYLALVRLRKILDLRRGNIRWNYFRYGLPTVATLFMAGAIFSGSDLFVIVVGILNLPAIVLAWPIAEFAIGAPEAIAGLLGIACGPIFWLAWYVIIRFIEEPASRGKPLSLGLGRPPTQ